LTKKGQKRVKKEVKKGGLKKGQKRVKNDQKGTFWGGVKKSLF
jgi:hypothetical protein